jgi:hypothetical protein
MFHITIIYFKIISTYEPALSYPVISHTLSQVIRMSIHQQHMEMWLVGAF